jgi:hypothetical protein
MMVSLAVPVVRWCGGAVVVRGVLKHSNTTRYETWLS